MPIKKLNLNGKMPTAKDYKLTKRLTEADKQRIASNRTVLEETANDNGDESTAVKQTSNSKSSNAHASAMKAFLMTNKRLHPELYKGNSIIGKVLS
jgi:hypothetical protein